MQISITGRHTTITEPLRQYAQEKIGKLDRYFEGIHDINVILRVEDQRQIAECVFHVPKGGTVVAEADGNDLYAAIDRVVEKMGRRLKRYKQKMRGPRHKDYGKRDSGRYTLLPPDEDTEDI